MARFEAALRRAESSLDLPGPLRARILLEMAGDLDALFEAYRARGLSEADAAAKAASALGVSGAAAGELARLHQPPYRRWTARLTERGRTAAERALVTAMFLVLVGIGIGGLANADLLTDATGLSWLLLAMFAAVVSACASLFFRLFLDQEPRDTRVQLRIVGWIAAAAPVVALIAVIRELDGIAAEVVAAGEWTWRVIAPGLRRAAQAATLGMTVGLAGFLAWFHLRRRFDALTRAEAELASADVKGGSR
jgi:hypothetical protein